VIEVQNAIVIHSGLGHILVDVGHAQVVFEACFSGFFRTQVANCEDLFFVGFVVRAILFGI
jgi:hypothetical protein